MAILFMVMLLVHMMFMGVVIVVTMSMLMAFINEKPQSGQGVIRVGLNTQPDIVRQSRSPYRADHAIAQVRKCIEDRSNEHVASDSTNRVEVNMHCRSGSWACQRAKVPAGFYLVSDTQRIRRLRARGVAPASDTNRPLHRT